VASIPDPLYRWNVNEIASLCRVSLKTARRWKSGQTVPPETAIMILDGDLSMFDPSWAGWRIRGEEIIPPAAWPVRREDALAVPLMHRQIAALRHDIARLKVELEEARSGRSEQPHPDTWTIKLG